MSLVVAALVNAVSVPLAPEWVREPALTWAEGALLVPFVASVGYFTFLLARAWWPRSRARQVGSLTARWWGVAFVAMPLLLAALYLMSKSEDNRFDRLRHERDQAVEELTDHALAELSTTYDVTPADHSRAMVDLLVDSPANVPNTTTSPFLDASGVEVDCELMMTPSATGRDLSLKCPAVATGKD